MCSSTSTSTTDWYHPRISTTDPYPPGALRAVAVNSIAPIDGVPIGIVVQRGDAGVAKARHRDRGLAVEGRHRRVLAGNRAHGQRHREGNAGAGGGSRDPGNRGYPHRTRYGASAYARDRDRACATPDHDPKHPGIDERVAIGLGPATHRRWTAAEFMVHEF